jgi:hypothetical protein
MFCCFNGTKLVQAECNGACSNLTDVFFLRTSAIQVSLMALGLSSVAEVQLSFARFRVQSYAFILK